MKSAVSSIFVRGVPTRVRVAVNGHPEIAGADPLLHDLFKFDRCLLLLIHAVRSLRRQRRH